MISLSFSAPSSATGRPMWRPRKRKNSAVVTRCGDLLDRRRRGRRPASRRPARQVLELRRRARASRSAAACRAARPGAAPAGTSPRPGSTNVLVAATPISRPARVNSTPSASRVACEPITLVIASTRAPRSRGQPHRGQRVGGLARLRDADHEVVRADDRVAVAVLGRDVHLHRHARPLLDRVAPDEARVVGGAAGHDHDPAQPRQERRRRCAQVAEIDAVVDARRGRRSSPRAPSACSWISLSMKVS